jgi:hypothetical protein
MPLTGPRPDASQVLQNIYDPTNNAIQVEIPGSAPLPVYAPTPLEVVVENTSSDPVPVQVLNDLIPNSYDALALTYYSSGPGNGQVETVTYYVGGQGGTVVDILTLTYNGAGSVATVTRTT